MMKRGSNKKTIAGIAALLLTVCAVAGGTALYERQQQEKLEERLREEAEDAEDGSWTDENTLYFDGDMYGFDHRIESFLFMGTDASGNEDGEGEEYQGAMADYLLLMVLDHTSRTYGYLQIDRNTITEVNEIGIDGELINTWDEQICTAHWYGGNREMSAENTVEAVKLLVGELDHIDGYYVVNMQDIGRLNHAVGGVEVTVDDDLTRWDESLTKGKTLVLSDEQAEAFIRARMYVGNEENSARMNRQRQYMDSFFKKVKENVMKDPEFATTLWNTLRDVAVTDMNGNVFSRIAQMFLKGESKGILTIKGESKLGNVLNDGLEHEEFYADPDSIREVMTELYSLVPVEE